MKGKDRGVLVVSVMDRNGPYKAKKKNIFRTERFKNSKYKYVILFTNHPSEMAEKY